MELITFVRQAEQQMCICPLCAAINDLAHRINICRDSGHVSTWKEGIQRLKAIKFASIEKVMNEMPSVRCIDATDSKKLEEASE